MELLFIHREKLSKYLKDTEEAYRKLGMTSFKKNIYLTNYKDGLELFTITSNYEIRFVTKELVLLTDVGEFEASNFTDENSYDLRSEFKGLTTLVRLEEAYLDILNHFGPEKFEKVLNKLNEYVYLTKTKPTTNRLNSINFSSNSKMKELGRVIRYMQRVGYEDIIRKFILRKKQRARERVLNVDKALRGSGRISFSYEFNHNSLVETNILALVGKNGVGKSQSLKEIKEDCLKSDLFRKVVCFDVYRANSNNNNQFVSLNRLKGENITLGLVQLVQSNRQYEFFNSRKLLQRLLSKHFKMKRMSLTMNSGDVVNFLNLNPKNSLEVDFSKKPIFYREGGRVILSTGQQVLLSFVVQLLLNIQFNSVLLIDEPENSMHPNFVIVIKSIIEDVLKETNSIAVVSTHDVFFVRELPKESVLILTSDNDHNTYAKISNIETFGASLDELATMIFFDHDIKNSGDRFAKKISKLEAKKKREYIKSLPSELAIKVLANDR